MRKLTLVLICSFFFNAAFAQSYIEPLKKLNKKLETFYYGTKLGYIKVEKGIFYFIFNGWGDSYGKAEMKDLANAVNDDELEMVKIYTVNKENRIFHNRTSNILKGYVSSDQMYFYFGIGSGYKSDRLELANLLNDFISSYNKEFSSNINSILKIKTTKVTPTCIYGNCENGFGRYLFADSSRYEGNWKDGKKEGTGILYKTDGIRVSGNWVNDEIAGKGKVYYPKEDPVWGGENVYEGEIRNNQPNGQGILYIYNSNFKNKTTLKGNFVDGKINGKGEYYRLVWNTKTEKQEETYVGNFKDGLYDGFGIYKLTSHYPKAKEKGSDNIESYEGDWKKGRKDGAGKYFCNYINNEKKYAGQWANGLEDGIGIHGGGEGWAKVEGLWREGNELNTKYTDAAGIVLYDGGKKERDLYWARMRQADVEREALANAYYISSGQAERDRKEKADLAARIAAISKKECICDKCGGSGKMSIRSAKIWYSDVYENGKKVGTATNSGWEYEDLKCTRCLGSGKCK